MRREEEIKISILKEARDVAEGKGLGYSKDPLEISVARELVSEELVIGHDSNVCSGVIITGIRDAGLDYLENRNQHNNVTSHAEPPPIAKWIMWVFQKETWKYHPIIALIVVVIILATIIGGISTAQNLLSNA
jgi:hypothetical protein